MNKKALVVFSGGQDSTTCLFYAINKYGKENVGCISFNYNQKHKIELEKAKNICNKLGILDYKVLSVEALSQLGNTSLTDNSIEVKNELNEKNLPNSFVPGRNILFLTLASAYAYQKGYNIIITGTCETDYSGYPDCRDIAIKAINVAINIAMEYNLVIETPLMWLNKAETFKLAKELNCLDFILENTHTCYNGVDKGCHQCPSCKLRDKGYQEFLQMK